MSNFNCEKCDAPHWDTPQGYISGCLCNGGYNQTCDVCKGETELINPDGWLRCPRCCQVKESENENR